MSGVIHIAGVHVQIGERLCQRCAWCGTLLIDYDLSRIAVPVGQDPMPGIWPHGELVLVDGGMSASVEHKDGDPLPDGACGKIDPEAQSMLMVIAGREHRYLSTACLHGQHDHCLAMVGFAGAKRPAQCKFCEARCVCPQCHGAAEESDPAVAL